ncbi:MAG: metal-sensing transcriptional repressor [Clostridiales bacterium]|nr:metal-sensing transcriptional repressor [Clostridiales bacterium]
MNRIEGQIRGMVEKSAYCPDILVQVAAANAALSAASTSSALNPPRWSRR